MRADRSSSPVAGIVLAAGVSSRMGRNKMLLEIDGEPLLHRAARVAAGARLSPIIVVLGHEADRARTLLAGLPCVPVVNEHYLDGIQSSVRAGIEALPDTAAAAVVVLADMPLVTSDMITRVVGRYRDSTAPLVLSSYEGINAPPTLYDRALFRELTALEDPAAESRWSSAIARKPLSWIDRPAKCSPISMSRRTWSGSRCSSEATMRSELLDLAAKLASAREPFVVAVVVRREPASSAQVGNMAVISARGEFHGWLGGSCIRPTIVREAQAALADGQPRLVSLSPDPSADTRRGVSVLPMTCHSGGTVDIYVEPVLPEPELLVFGTTPVARALATLGKGMGYSVDVVDPEADAAMLPDAGTRGRSSSFPLGANRDVDATPEVRSALRIAIVATHGERDEEALAEALETRPDYLGVVASRKRFAQIRETLIAGGVSAAALERVRNPAGLDIGAKTPEEIALSILAEVVQVRRQGAQRRRGSSLRPPRRLTRSVA